MTQERSHAEQIATMIVQATSVYPKFRLERDAIAVYVKLLGKYPLDVVDDALCEAMNESAEYMPTPGAIAKKCARIRGDQVDAQGTPQIPAELADPLRVQTESREYNVVLRHASELFRDARLFPRTARGKVAAIFQAEHELHFRHPHGEDGRGDDLRRLCAYETVLHRRETMTEAERLEALEASARRREENVGREWWAA